MISRNKAGNEQKEAARSAERCCCNPQQASAMMPGSWKGAGWDCESMLQAMMQMCAGREAQNETGKSAEHAA